MTEAFSSFIELVKAVAPYSLAWALGIRAFNFVVGAIIGKDVSI